MQSSRITLAQDGRDSVEKLVEHVAWETTAPVLHAVETAHGFELSASAPEGPHLEVWRIHAESRSGGAPGDVGAPCLVGVVNTQDGARTVYVVGENGARSDPVLTDAANHGAGVGNGFRQA